jgi:hypothetical protein
VASAAAVRERARGFFAYGVLCTTSCLRLVVRAFAVCGRPGAVLLDTPSFVCVGLFNIDCCYVGRFARHTSLRSTPGWRVSADRRIGTAARLATNWKPLRLPSETNSKGMAVAAFVAGDEWEAAAYRNRIESCTVGCSRLHRSPGRSVDEEPIACRGALATRHIPAVDCWAARMHVDSWCVGRRRRLLVRDPATLYLGIACHSVHAREFTLRWPPPWVCWVGVGRHPMVWELTSPWLGPLWRS